jgi:hypothetical protein
MRAAPPQRAQHARNHASRPEPDANSRPAAQLVTAAYEAAAVAQPGDRVLQDLLFGAYVRDALLVKQQQAR